MSKHLETPTSRLICVGSAKLRTNAGLGQIVEEYDQGPYYN
jgi:hypothetical protein